MERIAITGATSMIGAALVREALAKGTEVFALVRKDTPKLSRLPLEAEGLHLVPFDLTDAGSIETLSEKIPACDVFYHLAWGHTGSARNASVLLQAENVATCLAVLDAAANAGCLAFVGAGSQAEYGPKDLPVISPDTKTDPATPYGAAKLAACHLSRMLAKEKGIRWVWPRIFSVYGIYDKPSSMVASSLEKMLRGEPTHFSPARHRWDYLFSEDAGRAYYAIGESGRDGSIYCVGSGESRPLLTFLEEMAEAAGVPLTGVGDIPYKDGQQPRNLAADITSLTADTGFVPEVPFKEGIRRTAEYINSLIDK